jgi:hypothetical protein
MVLGQINSLVDELEKSRSTLAALQPTINGTTE